MKVKYFQLNEGAISAIGKVRDRPAHPQDDQNNTCRTLRITASLRIIEPKRIIEPLRIIENRCVLSNLLAKLRNSKTCSFHLDAEPTNTQCRRNVLSTSLQRHDVAATLL